MAERGCDSNLRYGGEQNVGPEEAMRGRGSQIPFLKKNTIIRKSMRAMVRSPREEIRGLN